MGFKSGMLIGFGTGYVLGSKAGRERYEQIRSAWDRFSGNPRVQQLADRSKELAEEASRKSLYAVQKASSVVKDRLGSDEDETTPTVGQAGV